MTPHELQVLAKQIVGHDRRGWKTAFCKALNRKMGSSYSVARVTNWLNGTDGRGIPTAVAAFVRLYAEQVEAERRQPE